MKEHRKKDTKGKEQNKRATRTTKHPKHITNQQKDFSNNRQNNNHENKMQDNQTTIQANNHSVKLVSIHTGNCSATRKLIVSGRDWEDRLSLPAHKQNM